MVKYVLILLLVIVLQSDSRCTFDKIKAKADCNSVDTVEKAGDQTKLTYILIKSLKIQQKIKLTTFLNIPNLEVVKLDNSVNDIEEQSFTDLSSLEKIMFVKCDLPVIKKHWFSNLSISYLELTDSKVTSFESNCLEGSKNLDHVVFSKNNISHIPTNVFNGTLISKLILTDDNIIFIEEKAFANMTNLETLELNGNFLTSFNPKLIMGNAVPSLRTLFLHKNQIKCLFKDNFVAFSNMSTLHLHFNELGEIHAGAFNGLTKLTWLDMSDNKLELFPERALPYEGLPSLLALFLHNNRLNYLPRSFIQYFPELIKISFFGNPWQCVCYKEIRNSCYHNNVIIDCSKGYLNGERPVCVVPETRSDMCAENIKNANDLYETYIQALNNYENIQDYGYCRW